MSFNIRKSLLGAALLVPAMGLTIANADNIQDLTINASANFRAAATKYSTSLGKFSKGDKVEYLGISGNWYKVQANGQVGYVYKDYVDVTYAVSVASSEKSNNLTKYVNCSSLNLRSQATTSSSIVKTLSKGTEVSVLYVTGNWSKVSVNGLEGFVYSSYLSDGTSAAIEDNTVKSYQYVTATSVNLREGASTSTAVICKVSKDTKVGVISSTSNWAKVKYNSTYGYIHTSNLADSKASAETPSTSSSTSAKIDKMMSIAASKIGCRYVRGSEGPNTFDCSGFTGYLYKQIGVSIPRSSSQQKNAGTYVSKSNLKKGDLVFLDTSGNGAVDHACIYVGNGEIIHANSSAGKITRSDLNSSYYRSTYVCARRILD